MNGIVGEFGRAVIELSVRSATHEKPVAATAWIDTAFSGELVIPRRVIDAIRLTQSAGIRARLADGNEVTMESFACALDWFGSERPVEVMASCRCSELDC